MGLDLANRARLQANIGDGGTVFKTCRTDNEGDNRRIWQEVSIAGDGTAELITLDWPRVQTPESELQKDIVSDLRFLGVVRRSGLLRRRQLVELGHVQITWDDVVVFEDPKGDRLQTASGVEAWHTLVGDLAITSASRR